MAVPAFGDPSIGAKRAQAEQVMAKVQQLGQSLESAIAQYQYASIQLQQIHHSQALNRRELKIARANLKTSQRTIAKRLVSLYRGDQVSTLEVILGAKSLDDMLNRLDTEKSVTRQDTSVLTEIRASRTAMQVSAKKLAKANESQTRIVAERAAKKQQIESTLAEQHRLLSSIKNQIAQLQAAQRAEQLRLQQQAELRLQAERAAALQRENNTIVGATASTPNSPNDIAPPSQYSTGVVGAAMTQLGVPYIWGGATPGVGFDCSGLVMWAYAQVGVSLPHSSYAMWNYGVPVSESDLEPGDLVFFNGLDHVGMYIGNGQFIEAPHTGAYVQISSLFSGWYAATYVGARRIL
ncbi:MAG TPA: NlpC/P60 family protein [Gaiellaceae bacterium]|nr:NlpC/P60 family protein [Gaiellaceae bacterium]